MGDPSFYDAATVSVWVRLSPRGPRLTDGRMGGPSRGDSSWSLRPRRCSMIIGPGHSSVQFFSCFQGWAPKSGRKASAELGSAVAVAVVGRYSDPLFLPFPLQTWKVVSPTDRLNCLTAQVLFLPPLSRGFGRRKSGKRRTRNGINLTSMKRPVRISSTPTPPDNG